MKTKLFTLLLALTCALAINAQLLYRISGNGLSKPSYIIGTHHLADTKFVDSIPGVRDALDATTQAYGELSFDDMLNPDSMAYLQSAMMLPEGQKLKDILTKEQFQKLNDGLKKMLMTDLTNPMLEAQMGGVTPKALLTQLTLLAYLTKHPGSFDPTKPFDMYFTNDAKQKGKTVGGLETMAFQANVLLKSTPMSRQIEQLMCYLDHKDKMDEMAENISKAFYAQDLETIKKVMDEKLDNSCDDSPEEEAQLIDHRNADWLKKMPEIMAAQPTFFAVGAAHLPGEKGVLDGLRRLGYTVEGVK